MIKMRLFIFFAFALCGIAEARDRLEIASDIIGLYQPLAREMFRKEIYLWIEPSNENPNAYASFNGPRGSPRIRILTSTLREFEDDEIAATVCHELGHFFGDRTFGEKEEGIALEGEADYFAGSCLMRYLTQTLHLSPGRAVVEAISIAKNEAQAFEYRRLDPNRARSKCADGINRAYPDPDCRLLTVIHGIRKLNRPVCWFNP